jgi:hypothetical protein
MIERYFVEGAKYAWVVPGAVSNVPRDGSINPTAAAAASVLTFQDLDSDLFDTRQINKFRSLGLTKGGAIAHDWLNYVHGQIATINTHNDVLTGFMSGCIIVVYNDGTGARQVGHIGTIDGSPKDEPPNSTVKNGFAAAMPGFANVAGYNPAAAWDPSEITAQATKFKNPPWGGRIRIVSLVTGNGQFFSILLLQRDINVNEYVCGGIKSCPAMSPHLLQQALA